MNIKKNWQDFELDVYKLADKMGDYKPDVIVPSMAGALVPAGIISEVLKVKDIRPINIERSGKGRRIVYDIKGDITGLKILLLEDSMNTGFGLLSAKKIYENRGAKVKIASVYVNEQSEKIADFFGEKLEFLPNFPWKPNREEDRKLDLKHL
jgi:hypoxanthine phosphoribosyltransferase